ncbi:cyclin-D3-3-like [Mercurialis annua]|uniref:cyclin-D3-3-like n=1 Tax=Mercurialis annua TaxID=3986 RepID=UPI00215F36BB|nr:cyclin-D3-3-like [Mercurialis annua]
MALEEQQDAALYCCEENWEDDDDEQEEDEMNNKKLDFFMTHGLVLNQDLFWEDDELSSLLAKQEQSKLYKKLETSSSLAKARREAIEWMFKVNAYYSFTALTAVLAVNYLDRFLFSFHVQTEKPWMTQLAAVACLSIAAKVEETHVPLLLDLQVEESRYVFEAKTIQKMEILVLSTLQWRMNPVTPLSFLDYITTRLGLKSYLSREFLRRFELIVLSIISDSRSVAYLPSVIASATMLHLVNGVGPCVDAEYQSHLLGILETDKEKVNECSMLVLELASREHDRRSNKRKYASDPGSPNGVMDVSFSSDSSNDSWAVSAPSSVSSSPEHPLMKKKKNRAMQSLNEATADFRSIIPR